MFWLRCAIAVVGLGFIAACSGSTATASQGSVQPGTAGPSAPGVTAVRQGEGPSLEIGDPRTLLASGALGLTYFPDEGTSLVSRTPEFRLILTALKSTYRVEGTDIEHLSKAVEVLRPGGPGSFDNGYAGISAVVEVGGTLYGYYHAEDQENLPGLAGGIPGFYASIGVATSGDGGRTWTKQGQVLTSSKPKQWQAYKDQGDRGIAEPGAVLTRDGKAVLLYYTEHSRANGRAVDIGVARADLVNGAPGPGAFRKYRGGAFSEPGLGGEDTPIVTASAFPKSNALEAHVTWSEAAQRYLMLVGVDAWEERTSGRPASTSGLYYAWSADGVKWSAINPLIVDQAVPQAGKSLTWEASVIWDDPTGNAGWLVYGYTPRWGTTPHYLVGRRLRVRTS